MSEEYTHDGQKFSFTGLFTFKPCTNSAPNGFLLESAHDLVSFFWFASKLTKREILFIDKFICNDMPIFCAYLFIFLYLNSLVAVVLFV